MKATSFTCTTSAPKLPQFKFNNMFNKYFPCLIFFSTVFSLVNTGEVEVDCYLKLV